MEPTGEKKMNMSSRFSPRTLAFLGVAALLLVAGAVMAVRSQASVAATAVSAPSSLNAAAEHDYAARRSSAHRAAIAAAVGRDYAARLAAVERAYYMARDTANLQRSNAAAQYAAIAEYYAHLMLTQPAIGNGSVTSEITPMGEYSAGRTAPSEKPVPGGGP
jgi:hypothetical protein